MLSNKLTTNATGIFPTCIVLYYANPHTTDRFLKIISRQVDIKLYLYQEYYRGYSRCRALCPGAYIRPAFQRPFRFFPSFMCLVSSLTSFSLPQYFV